MLQAILTVGRGFRKTGRKNILSQEDFGTGNITVVYFLQAGIGLVSQAGLPVVYCYPLTVAVSQHGSGVSVARLGI